MAKLWAKGYRLNELIEQFTVGDDYLLDQDLVRFDALASIAHVKMLERIRLLTKSESRRLRRVLRGVIVQDRKGTFKIKRSDEDVHTRVENHITAQLGDVGRKLHTGRSRNDQVIVDLRLYGKEKLLELQAEVAGLAGTLVAFARKHEFVPMAGRTHTQKAMLSSLGLWAGAFAESLLDDLKLIETAYDLSDQCPLGSAASYGVPLPIDRQYVSDQLGFSRVQSNVLYANNSRGKMEAIVLSALVQVTLDLSKLATDLIFFSVPELAYFTFPDEFCTGSSIMPQKKNPAGMEMVRAKSTTVSRCLFQILDTIKGLPSGYNRDFQETKEPFFKGLRETLQIVRVCDVVMKGLKVNRQALIDACTPELFAADHALRMAASGIPFRTAYHEVAKRLNEIEQEDPVANIRKKRHMGAPGNLGLAAVGQRVKREERRIQHESARFDRTLKKLLRP